jgi:hypothetical protein
MTDDVTQSDVDALAARIADSTSQRRKLTSVCRRTKAELVASRLAARCFSAASSIRQIADKLGLWRGAIVILFPFAFAAGAFVLSDIMTGRWVLSTVVACVCAVGMLLLTLSLLIMRDDHGTDDRRYAAEARIAQLMPEVRLVSQRITDLDIQIVTDRKHLQELRTQLARLQLIRSLQYQRERLYDRNWRAMRGGELEIYLAEVFALLGYTVEATGKSGDQGVDLIVAKSAFRVAVQIKGYHDSVGNSAVQEAYSGMAFRKCQGCAVITNSRFTPSAIVLAQSTGCILVHEHNFRDFVFGTFDLIAHMTSIATAVPSR